MDGEGDWREHRSEESIRHSREYKTDFVKRNYTPFEVRFRNILDAAIIKALKPMANRTQYIRDLIQADIDGPRHCDDFIR